MESYPQTFAGLLKVLAEEARCWAAAHAGGDGEDVDANCETMEDIKGQLCEQGVLPEDPCQQLYDMALSAAAVTLCRVCGMDGLEDREQEFNDACEPVPEEVSEQLWTRTQELFLAGARLACAEARGDDAEAERQQRMYDRHARSLAGFGKIKSSRGPDRSRAAYAEEAARVIPATVVMFSGCQDCQTSADVYNTASFGLPTEAGPGGAGGACTSSMIKALSDEGSQTWVSLLDRMRQILAGKYSQIPMLSSSRSMDLNEPFSVANAEPGGRFRALLVGINYVGSKCELKGCHNDVETMRRYLCENGYGEDDMTILLDDGGHEEPNKCNIVRGFQWLVEGAGPGDSLFFHYSGHGASVRDDDGDEEDGMDECLCPSDYDSAGLLRDDDTFKYLVAPLQEGAWLTCVLDCCHSGTILDLPYVFKANDDNLQAFANGDMSEMQPNANFDFGKLLQVVKDHPGMCAGAAAIAGMAYFVAGPDKSKDIGRTLMGVMTSDNPGTALMGAAGSIMGSLFGK